MLFVAVWCFDEIALSEEFGDFTTIFGGEGLKLTPDETLAQDDGWVGEGNGIVCVANVNGFIAQKLTILVRWIESVNGGEGQLVELVALFFLGVVNALTHGDAAILDFDNAPLGLFENSATEALGGITNGAKLAKGVADGALDGRGEALEGEVAVRVPSEGSVLEQEVLFGLGLAAFGNEVPDTVLRGDEGAGEQDGDGINGVVHVGEVAHIAFGDDFGLLSAIEVDEGLSKARVELGEHAEEVVFCADFLRDAAGEEDGADGLATVTLEPPQDSTVSELGDGGGLGEHALGHAFGFVDGEHFELGDALPESPLFFWDGGGAVQIVDGGEVLLFSPDLQRDDLAVWTGGLDGLPAAVADELACGAGAFEAVDGVEGKDEGVHGIGGALAAGEDVVEVDGFATDVPGIEGFAGVRASVAQVGSDAHFPSEAGSNGGRVTFKGLCGFLCGLKGGATEGGDFGVDFFFLFSGEVFNVAGDLDEEFTDSGGVVLGVVVDDVAEEAEEDFDSVADEVVVGGAVDVGLGERVFLGGIAIEDAAFRAGVFAGEDFGDGLAHDALGVGCAAGGEGRGEFFGRRLLAF